MFTVTRLLNHRNKIAEVPNTSNAEQCLRDILTAEYDENSSLNEVFTVASVANGGNLWDQTFGGELKLKGKSDIVVVPCGTLPEGYARQLRLTYDVL